MAPSYRYVEGVGEGDGWAKGWVETGWMSIGTVDYGAFGGDACGFHLGAMHPTIRLHARRDVAAEE